MNSFDFETTGSRLPDIVNQKHKAMKAKKKKVLQAIDLTEDEMRKHWGGLLWPLFNLDVIFPPHMAGEDLWIHLFPPSVRQ